MLTDGTREIVEHALGRSLNAGEEFGYPTLSALPPNVVDAARTIRQPSNLVAVSVYLRHVVPSATLAEVLDFIDDLPLDTYLEGPGENELPIAKLKAPQTDDDRALAAKWRADREARVKQLATERPPARKLPADSPIFKKWEAEPFPGGPDADDREERTSDSKGKERRDVDAFLDMLAKADPRTRALALIAIGGRPRADERLLAACERLLEDRAITLLTIPYTFGEVRWVAAGAVAAVRGLLGRNQPVVIEDAFAPVSAGRVDTLAIEAGITPSTKGGVDGDIETLQDLAAAGKLPRRRVELAPFVPPAY